MRCKINCVNPYDFGCISTCAKFNVGVAATVAGVYTLITYFMGRKETIETEFVDGEILCFDIECLNESYLYNFIIVGPNGSPICVRHSDVIYDCFKFRTQVGDCVPNAAPAFELIDCDLVEYIECVPCGETVIKSAFVETQNKTVANDDDPTFITFNLFDFIPPTVDGLVYNYKKDELIYIAKHLQIENCEGTKAEIASRILQTQL